MKKEYILTFCISFIILLTVVVISLMMLLPQRSTVTENSIEDYTSIKKSDYTFKQTNLLSFDSLVKSYVITENEMAIFKNNYQFVPGNSDPFTVQSAGDGNTTTSNTTNTTTNASTSTTDKITNSNGGVANPNSTGK